MTKNYRVEVCGTHEGGRCTKKWAFFNARVKAENKAQATEIVKGWLIGQRVKDIYEGFPINFKYEPKARTEKRTCYLSDGQVMEYDVVSLAYNDQLEHVINEHDFEEIGYRVTVEA